MTYYQTKPSAFVSYEKPDKAVKPKSKSIIPKRKDKPATGLSHALKTKWGYVCQSAMFDAMWEKALIEGGGKVICPFTNINLTAYAERDMSYYLQCFAHILPKGKYPLYKLNNSNVRIVAPLFHKIVDQGRLSDRDTYPTYKWGEWDQLVNEKKIEYTEFIKTNT